MKQLIIRMSDGIPVNHPMLLSNFTDCFSHIDINNLPEEFKFFERVPQPSIGVYQKLESEISTYQLIDGVVKDVWTVLELTPEEKQQKISDVMNQEHPNGFIFDEELCSWVPPLPRPTDGNYMWDEELCVWIELEG